LPAKNLHLPRFRGEVRSWEPRGAEYVAERLKDVGYVVRFEEFEFPFFEDRTPPVLVAPAFVGDTDHRNGRGLVHQVMASWRGRASARLIAAA
jgi:hypothetical protein